MTPRTRSDIGRSMAVGAGWMILLRLADRGVGLVSLAVLARLLLPEDFGLIALAVSFIALIDMLGQFGVEVALIQNQHAERRHYDSAWTVNLVTAVVISALLVLLAGRASAFFGEPRVEWIIDWLALANVIRALENIGVVDFRKRLEFHKEFTYLMTVRLTSTAVTLLIAIYWREYWALVAGAVAQAAIRAGVSYVVSAYRPRISRAGLGDIFHFSKWMLVQNVIHGLNEKATALVIGRLSNASALAHYSVAYEISNLATTELAAPIRRALLPGLAIMAGDVRALRDGFIRTIAVIALIGLPVPVGIALTAPWIVAVLLGPNWSAAVPLIQVLALHGILRTLGTGSSVVYLAVGKPRITALLSAMRLVMLMPLLIWLAGDAGALGAAWAMVFTSAVIWAIDIAIQLRVLNFEARLLFNAMWRPIVAALLMSTAVHYFETSLPMPGSLFGSALQLTAIVVLGAAAYVTASLILWRACLSPKGAESTIYGLLRRTRAFR